MKAYVLIHVRTGSINEVIRNLKRSSDILEANMTFGPYDIVAVVKAPDVNHLGHLIATERYVVVRHISTVNGYIITVSAVHNVVTAVTIEGIVTFISS